MIKVFDHEAYKKSYSHRLAYAEGKLDLCEQIVELAHIILANNKVSLFKPNSEFEEGQVAALSAILDSIASIQESTTAQSLDDQTISFDA